MVVGGIKLNCISFFPTYAGRASCCAHHIRFLVGGTLSYYSNAPQEFAVVTLVGLGYVLVLYIIYNIYFGSIIIIMNSGVSRVAIRRKFRVLLFLNAYFFTVWSPHKSFWLSSINDRDDGPPFWWLRWHLFLCNNVHVCCYCCLFYPARYSSTTELDLIIIYYKSYASYYKTRRLPRRRLQRL